MMNNNKNKEDDITIEMLEKKENPVMDYRLTKKSALGMFLVALASTFGSLMSSGVSYVAKKYKLPAFTITFVRSVFNILINLCFCAYLKVNPLGPYKETRKFTWVILRGLFGGIQITCYFFAFTKMGVGDATTLTFTAPVITGFLGIFMLKEKWGKVNAIASILCFVGVLFTVKPTWLFPDVQNPLNPWDATIAFVGSIAAALAYISVRKAGPSVSVFVLINYALLFTLLINIYQGYVSPKHIFPWPPVNTPFTAWLLLAGISVFGALAQYCINRGLQLEKAGPASSMRFLDVILSYGWQILFFHQSDIYGMIGALLVSLCLIIIGLNKWWTVRKVRLAYEASLLNQQQ